MTDFTDSEGVTADTLIWLFDQFDKRGVQYCILRNHNKIPYHVGNDIDILVANRDNEAVRHIVEQCAETFGWIIYPKSSMYFILSRFTGSWIHLKLDFVNNLQSRGLTYLPGEMFLEARKRRKDGIYVLSPTLEYVHLLVHALFGPAYNQELYISILSRKLTEDDLDMVQVKRCLHMVFPSRLANRIVDSIEEGDITSIFQDRASLWRAYLKKNRSRRVWLRSEIDRWTDRIWRIINPRGLFVVLVGPDGVGKSTAASLTTSLLQTAHPTRHIHLGFRPGILPSKKDFHMKRVATSSLQTSEKGHWRFKTPSLIRLLYNTLDYILGYYLRIRPLLVRGNILIVERYYYDYLVLLPRKVAGAPSWLARLLLYFVPKPDMLVLLYCNPETIHKRKDELSIPEIERQSTEFETLGEATKGRFYKITTDKSPDKVALEIGTVIREVLSR